MSPVIVAIISAVVAGGGTFAYFKFIKKDDLKSKVSQEEILSLADEKITQKLDEADKKAVSIQREADEYARNLRQEMVEQEKLLVEREKALSSRSKHLDEKAQESEKKEEQIKYEMESIEKLRTKIKDQLEEISKLTREEARERLIAEVDEDLKDYKAKSIRDAQKKVEEESQELSKHILVETMQRIVTDYVGETTTSSVKLEDEKIKGRVIGKDGRNIRAFEKATGVDVIVDEAPNSIGLSSFDPLRREIAKVALEKLIGDGRIHPGTIEDEIRKAKNEIATEIKKNGQILAEEAGWPGIDAGLLKLIGKMKYRTSYGQSLMKHTIEVIRIGSALASELNADVDLVKKACLLHDVGKVLTHKVEGAHHHISGQIARKYTLPDRLINAIEAHHLDIEAQSVEAVIVYLADAISGARPGARKDSYEAYIKRVEGLENVAKEVGGEKIDDVYAIHAGREVRVIVKPNETSDDTITVMAKEIADKIQQTQTYPGTVQVTVIREKRAEQTAS